MFALKLLDEDEKPERELIKVLQLAVGVLRWRDESGRLGEVELNELGQHGLVEPSRRAARRSRIRRCHRNATLTEEHVDASDQSLQFDASIHVDKVGLLMTHRAKELHVEQMNEADRLARHALTEREPQKAHVVNRFAQSLGRQVTWKLVVVALGRLLLFRLEAQIEARWAGRTTAEQVA